MIELAREEDWARCRALRLLALGSDPDAFGSTLQGEQGQPESFWRARIPRADATLLASMGGEDVGLAVVASSWDEVAEVGGLYSVWVAPQARGRGVGVALIEAVIEQARQVGYARLQLDVGDENEAAIALYARMGFEPTGRTSRLDPPREHITEHERAMDL